MFNEEILDNMSEFCRENNLDRISGSFTAFTRDDKGMLTEQCDITVIVTDNERRFIWFSSDPEVKGVVQCNNGMELEFAGTKETEPQMVDDALKAFEYGFEKMLDDKLEVE